MAHQGLDLGGAAFLGSTWPDPAVCTLEGTVCTLEGTVFWSVVGWSGDKSYTAGHLAWRAAASITTRLHVLIERQNETSCPLPSVSTRFAVSCRQLQHIPLPQGWPSRTTRGAGDGWLPPAQPPCPADRQQGLHLVHDLREGLPPPEVGVETTPKLPALLQCCTVPAWAES